MFKRLCLLLSLSFLCGLSAYSQTALTGNVKDNETGEPIIQCGLIITKNGIQVTTVVTDLDGNYNVQLDPGKYEVEARYVGYQSKKVAGINVLGGKSNTLNIKISAGIELQAVEVIQYRAPLIEKDNTTQGQVITAEKIKNLPVKSVLGVVSTAAGLSTNGDGKAYIRGSRQDATVYYLDGVRITGDRQIPTSEIEQLQVVTGGVEAQYGDVTGGIIGITSKGPSAKFSGGVEAETSQFTDPYGYNLLSANLSGPIIRQKLTDSTYGRTLLGFRIAGQYNYLKDDDPSAFPGYFAKQSTIDRLSQTPLERIGGTPAVSSQFLNSNEVDQLKYRPNQQNTAYDLTGKLDFRPVDNIDVSLSGNYSNVNDRFLPTGNFTGQGAWSLFNWVNNPVSDESVYRVNIRLRHRLGRLVDLNAKREDEGEIRKSSNIQNAFYTIQGGWQQDKKITQDWTHKDNFFDYGYIGKFPGHYNPEVRFFQDIGKTRHSGWHLQIDDFQPTFTDALGKTQNYPNPAYAALNTSLDFPANDLQNPVDPISGKPVNLEGFRSYNGFLSKSYDNTWGTIWNNVGAMYNRYEKIDNDLITLQVTSGFDFLPGGSKNGRHNIQFGLVYEQRIERTWTLVPFDLWKLARLYANNHIAGIDYTQPIWVDTFGVQPYGPNGPDTLFNTLISPAPEAKFYKSVRSILMPGINPDSAVHIWANIDQLTNKDLRLDMFSAKELTDQNIINFTGYDYVGNKLGNNIKFEDFFKIDANGNKSFIVAPFSPVYVGGYIQDKFTFKDIIFRLGLRADYFDANTKVLKDPYALYGILGAKEFHAIANSPKPGSIGDDYKVYVTGEGSTGVKAYRNGDQWYNSQGSPVNSSGDIFSSNLVYPRYIQPVDSLRSIKGKYFKVDESFEDYKPEINWMPRLAFSFPISDNSNFFAHYDILVQRPNSNANVSALQYYYFNDLGRADANLRNNGNLKPSQTVDYEVGFQQKISNSSAIKLSAYYKELRNEINRVTISRVAEIGSYDSYGNIDFGTVKGFNFSYDLRRTSNFEFTAAYTLQFADGTGSDPESQKGLTQKGINIRNIFPFSYDERHRFAFTADYRYESGKKYNGPRLGGQDILANTGLNVQIVTASGRPYSPGTQIVRYDGSGYRGDINGSRLPWNFNVDLRLDKNISLVRGKNSLDLNIYLRIQNLFDTKNVIGVYRGSGDAKDDGYLKSDKGAAEINNTISSYGLDYVDYFINQYNYRVINPDHYTQPRRIFVGAILEF